MAKNRAKCGNCGDIIESKHRHDWVACKCFKDTIPNQGIFIDGGKDYWRCGGNFKNLLRYDGKTRKWVAPKYEEPVKEDKPVFENKGRIVKFFTKLLNLVK